MGGAIVLMLHRKEPTFWDGAILVAPMCKVNCPRFPNHVIAALLSFTFYSSDFFQNLQTVHATLNYFFVSVLSSVIFARL
jgi:hypothetical protein